MKIVIEQDVYASLMTFAHASGMREFSGVGWIKVDGNTITLYDIRLLSAGSEAFTQIPPEKLLKAMEIHDPADMRVWFHRHPLGNGIPGPHNWSGVDEDNIKNTPLGGIPQLVGWSVSIVLTPGGWVGRIDNHIKGTTKHINVVPGYQAHYALMEILEEEWLEERSKKDPKVIASPELPKDWNDLGTWGSDFEDGFELEVSLEWRSFEMFLEDTLGDFSLIDSLSKKDLEDLKRIYENLVTGVYHGSYTPQRVMGWDVIESDGDWDGRYRGDNSNHSLENGN